MKRSLYNVMAQKDDEIKALLYNTFHDSQILIENKSEFEAFLKKIDAFEPLSIEENEFAESLKEMGFLVEDEADERAEFLDWFETKIRQNFEQLSSLILTSRTCNLRCPYCFEKDVLDRGLNMTAETARQVILWNKNRIDKYHPKKMDITFFGGEPLMNVPILKMIAGELSAYCRENEVEFEYGMITNGVLLTPELVRELLPTGLKWVKITLDGNQKDHDKLRITASGKGTFEKIWGNLEKLAGLVPIYIGGNFNIQNQKSLKSLVDKLNESIFRDNLYSVTFKPIMETFNEGSPKMERPIRTDFAEPAFNKEQADVMMKMRGYILSKKLPVNTQIGLGPCELHRNSYFGIDMNGKLYKCSAMVGRHGFESGDVWKGEDQEKVNERMGTGIRPWKDCGDCPFIPVCAGGCKASGYNKYGDFTVGSCDKAFFTRMVGEMFERNLKEEVAYEDGFVREQAAMLKDGYENVSKLSTELLSGTLSANNGDAESFAV